MFGSRAWIVSSGLFFAAALLGVALAACGKKEEPKLTSAPAPSPASEPAPAPPSSPAPQAKPDVSVLSAADPEPLPTQGKSAALRRLPTQGKSAALRRPILPEFPWPPPRTTARYRLPRALVTGNSQAPSIGDIADRMEGALYRLGYTELSYYAAPDGYALVTRLEQIHEDGRPMEEPARWAARLEPLSLKTFSLEAYIKALFRAARGYYRVIVFVASPHPFSESPAKVSHSEAVEWLHAGLTHLPESVRSQAYTKEFECTALVYEFEQSAAGEQARRRDPSPLTGELHLRGAKILAALAN